MSLRHLAVLFVLAAAVPFPGQARADTTECTVIDANITTLTQQGVYCLKATRSYGNSVETWLTIAASNVTIDCNGYAVSQLSGFPNSTTGIKAVGRNNVTIRNCVLSGFRVGIELSGDGHVVEDTAVSTIQQTDIQVIGQNGMVRRNRLMGIGGVANTSGPSAIIVGGSVDVLENHVAGVSGLPAVNSTVWAIRSTSSVGTRIARNRIYGLQPTGTGSASGILALNGANNVVTGNTLVHAGDNNGVGVSCAASDDASVSGNHFIGWNSVTLSCSTGQNVVKP